MNNLRNPFAVPQECVQVLIFVPDRSPAKEESPSTEVTRLVLQMIPGEGMDLARIYARKDLSPKQG